MTKLLEKAIERVRALPKDRQDELAELILDLAQPEPTPSALTDEHLAEVELSLQEAEEGKFASDEEVAALWKTFGL